MSGPVGNNNQDPAAVAAVAAAAAAVEEGNGRVAPELNPEQQESADRAAVVATNVLAHQQKEEQKVSSNKEDENKPESGEGKEAVEVAVQVAGQEGGEEVIEVEAGNSTVVASGSSLEEVEVGRQPSEQPPQQPPVGASSAGASQGPPAASVTQSSSTPPALGETGRTHKGDVTHTFVEITLPNRGTQWQQSSIEAKTSDPSEKAAKYFTVSNVSTLLGIATEATRAAGLAGECVDRLGTAGGFFKGANTAMGIVETGVKVVDAVDKGIAFVQNGKNLDKGLAFGGAAANAAAAGVSATKNLTEAGIIPISPEVNNILGGIGQGLKFVAGVFNIAEATKKLVDNRFTVKGEKVSEILKIAAAVAVIFMAIVGIIALFGVALPALLLPIAGVAVAVSALASGIVKGIVSSNKNKFAKCLINGEPCAVAV